MMNRFLSDHLPAPFDSTVARGSSSGARPTMRRQFSEAGPRKLRPLFGSFADANGTIRSNAPGAVDAVGASNMSVDWWWLADYRSAIGSSASRPINAIDASRGMRVVAGREHTQTDNDNDR